MRCPTHWIIFEVIHWLKTFPCHTVQVRCVFIYLTTVWDDTVVPEYIWRILKQTLWFHPKVMVGGLRIEDEETEPVTSLCLSSEKTKKSWLISLLSAVCALAFSFPRVRYVVSQKIYFLREYLVISCVYLLYLYLAVPRKCKIINSSL